MAEPAHDIVIRGGTLADGNGGDLREVDIAIADGRIAQVGGDVGPGREEIDARGLAVLPGFVDPHTHYDGQVTWEDRMVPSSNHGVTTVVMGNCGVGFAPCRPADRDMMIELMEGVEDIPEIVMAAGLRWNWETFPEYLAALDQRHADVDFAAQIAHSPLRVYTMGRRGADREAPSAEDLARMRALVAEGMRAGAVGVSTSRSLNHRSASGKPAPSVLTEEDELLALAAGLADAGRGVYQMIHDAAPNVDAEFELMKRIVRTSGRPLSYTLAQRHATPRQYRDALHQLDEAATEGLTIRGQVFPRPIGTLFGLDLSYHPFALHPSFQALADKPLAEKVRAMRDPSLRARLLAEEPVHPNPFFVEQARKAAAYHSLGDPPVYEPSPNERMDARAARAGVGLLDYVYDRLLDDDGHAVFYVPAVNYADATLDAARELMAHPRTILGLGDGGAHYGLICDSSYPTFVLTRWVRDAPPGEAFSLGWAASALAREPAEALGLIDRGRIVPGYKADLNVIDMGALALHAPRPRYDLPSGGRRLAQEATGYRANIVSGTVTYRDGEPTGALPGRLVRAGRSMTQ